MDSTELEECIFEISAEHALSLGSPGEMNIFGDPLIPPRIGDQYQVELPSLKTESECLQLCSRLTDAEYAIRFGLAIPIIWVPDQVPVMENEMKEFSGTRVGARKAAPADLRNCCCSMTSSSTAGNPKTLGTNLKVTTCKQEPLDETSDHDIGSTGSKSLDIAPVENQMDMKLLQFQQGRPIGCTPLPDSHSTSWTDAEIESFILGLYIFGKNLVHVHKFMETKEMGDILSFYYGKFYRSDAHRRWSECRKIKRRRCIHGQRIFTGWRQHELLSRIRSSLPEESQNSLLEVTKSFTEGGISLEDYVLTLKATVGMKSLVDAVGIGKGKHDLTGIALDPAKASQVLTSRSEIPAGKACSSLTIEDIINFLTGDFRLSKTRSNDLFWEAVWPRLLARGWHSEQPKDQNCASSRHTLVFIIPGVRKFSRRKLVKGNHYFDSVSDVLKKIATDPSQLELEVEGAKESSSTRDGIGWVTDIKLDESSSPEHEGHCYLRPTLPSPTSDLMKFTVVDTSLVQVEAPFKVRELRSLPVDNACSYVSSSLLDETDSNSSREKQESGDVSLNSKEELDEDMSDNKKLASNMNCVFKKEMQTDHFDNAITVLNGRPINRLGSDGQYCSQLDEQPIKDMNGHSLTVKSAKPIYLSPVSKRRRLSACRYSEAGRQTCSVSRKHSKKEAKCQLKSPRDTVSTRPELPHGRICTSSSCKDSHSESGECIPSIDGPSTSAVTEKTLSDKKSQHNVLIDLNEPQLPPQCDASEPCRAEKDDSQGHLTINGTFQSETEKQHDDFQALGTFSGMPIEQQPTGNARRQSTRNRPPTTKALEALASGFLETRRRVRGSMYTTATASKSSHRTRKTVKTSASLATANHDSVISETCDSRVENVEEDCRSYANDTRLVKSHVEPDSNGFSCDSLYIPQNSYCSETFTQ